MSIAFGLKEEKSFVIVTEDGSKAYSIWFDNNLINDGHMHHISYTFNHGEGSLEIDGTSVSKVNYPFTKIYNASDTLLTVGEKLCGSISNFSCSYS